MKSRLPLPARMMLFLELLKFRLLTHYGCNLHLGYCPLFKKCEQIRGMSVPRVSKRECQALSKPLLLFQLKFKSQLFGLITTY